jgi:hypothetical protein
MYTYSPPARGNIVESSAYVSAPANASTPAAIQTKSTSSGDPTLQVITRVLRKTPVPIMLAMLIDVAAVSPRLRTSDGPSDAGLGLGVGSAISRALQTTLIMCGRLR